MGYIAFLVVSSKLSMYSVIVVKYCNVGWNKGTTTVVYGDEDDYNDDHGIPGHITETRIGEINFQMDSPHIIL